jgi:tetratricopeptide (TPR) repeat protein
VAYLHNGQLDEELAQFRRTVELDKSFYYGVWNLGIALEVKGQTTEAITEFQKATALSDDPVPLGMLGQLYGITGRKEEAKKILAQLLQRRSQHYTAAYSVALVYLGLGDKKEALVWLEKGYEEHDGFDLGPIRVDPLVASLHGDPRFEALAEKIVPARDFGKTAATTQ